MTDTKAQLQELLEEDFLMFTDKGDEYDGFETVHVDAGDKSKWVTYHEAVTKTPDGRYFLWHFALGNTEMQEHMGPDEIDGSNFLSEVEPREKVITITEWVAK